MKVYTSLGKSYNNTHVGVVLLSDRNDIYMTSNMSIQNTEDSEGHIAGIKRALSFVKNMKPLYAKNDLECIFESNEKQWVQSRLDEDLFINRTKESLGININIVEPTEQDQYYLRIAKQQYDIPLRYTMPKNNQER